jgi:hypothetical protein
MAGLPTRPRITLASRTSACHALTCFADWWRLALSCAPAKHMPPIRCRRGRYGSMHDRDVGHCKVAPEDVQVVSPMCLGMAGHHHACPAPSNQPVLPLLATQATHGLCVQDMPACICAHVLHGTSRG